MALGAFMVEVFQRWRGSYRSRLAAYQLRTSARSDDLEVWILHQLEWLRIVSRTTPMLGLVATMIPMGPALIALAANDARTTSESLAVAFSAVITALISASIIFFVLTIRRRWLLEELRQVERSGKAA